ncbi:transposase family protein [Pseudofrankia sp. DC12]|uniref:HARBI1 family protein n=1 Tax=Pseudofrankia sp. DC12 TaxID=683315 RepID=UPI0005F7C276|nr:transposase family protein [Pseudofrankia sp. DC12]
MSVTYTSVLPLSDHTVVRLATLLIAERRRTGTRSGTRALSPWEQAVFVLRWFCDGTPVIRLCRDNNIGKSVGYRYLHEGLAVLAWQAPDLRNALIAAKFAGYDHVIVDGTVIETDRVTVPGPTKGVDLWWSGKIKNHGANVQVVSGPEDGWPLWVSDVRPGREHDTTALRASGAPEVFEEWFADGGQVLGDGGYEAFGTQEGQFAVPFKKPKGGELTAEQKLHNRIHYALRAVGERANALLKVTFRLLRNVTIDPWKIGLVAKASLVILHTEYQRTT